MNRRLSVWLEQLSLPAELLLLDRTREWHDDIAYPFALDELLCRKVGQGMTPVLHMWRHPQALVLGLRDSRLPGAVRAMRELEEQGCRTVVRNSGGAAVPLDPGVLNVTLVLPKPPGGIGSPGDFRGDFELMYRIVGAALETAGAQVDKGEIAGSYCPGDYDISIGGRKFCGLAQRRQLNAYAVQAFIVAEGSGAERGERARAFYRTAAEGAAAEQYPLVEPERMASVSELLAPITAEQLAGRIAGALRDAGVTLRPAASGDLPDAADVAAMAAALRARYAPPRAE
ncbi:lipoate--protein ligase family protein [Paenibacillus hamazuiensis]|uniref:lipoate--protein ligase family protein n=1 Tax=Paenibacillus hamazuiensis TaxID=2936508 RepID=UPI00200F3D1F|nr:lipoate--protein ligase family protein [Paenibacillus hamazuiensis]